MRAWNRIHTMALAVALAGMLAHTSSAVSIDIDGRLANSTEASDLEWGDNSALRDNKGDVPPAVTDGDGVVQLTVDPNGRVWRTGYSSGSYDPGEEWNLKSGSTATAAAGAFSQGAYIEISLDSTVYAAGLFSWDSVSVSLWRNGTGADDKFQLAIDADGDGFSTNDLVGTTSVLTAGITGDTTITYAGTSLPTNTTTGVVRLYFWGNASPSGNFHLYDVVADYTPPAAASIGFSPNPLSLTLEAPDTTVNGTITASYNAGSVSSGDITISSYAVDSGDPGFSAALVDNTLGLSDLTEDITVTYSNAVGGLLSGQSASSTLEVIWTEDSSGVMNTSSIPVSVLYSAGDPGVFANAAGGKWENPANWGAVLVPTNDMLVYIDGSAGGQPVVMDADSWTYFSNNSLLKDGATGNYQIGNLFIGKTSTASLDIDVGAGNVVQLTKNAWRYIGQNSGSDGALNLISGTMMYDWNRPIIANLSGSKGRIAVTGPDALFQISRENTGISLVVGNANGGDADFYISDGTVKTRAGVTVGMNGTFEVYGSAADQIAIGTHGTVDGKWVTAAGATLKVSVDSGGLTPILIDEVDQTPGTGHDGIATFEAGTFLDVGFADGHVETNAWVVMEAEGGIVDNGLSFAPGVSSGWDFVVYSNKLWVAYGGADMPPRSLYVDTPVSLPAWSLFDYDGNSSFTSSDSSGYSVDVANGSRDQIFPVEYQQLSAGIDMTQVGQKITATFDVEMNATIGSYDKDFRFGFFDTTDNVQIISMNDLGPISGSAMSAKLGNEISYNNGNGGVFVDGDYALLSILYQTNGVGSSSGTIANGLILNELNYFNHSLERTGTNELTMTTVWMDSSSTSTYTAVIDESTTGENYSYFMPDGGYETFDGFGLQIHEQYSSADYTLSNFELSYTSPLPAGFGYSISGVTQDLLGDVTLTLSDAVPYATYVVWATDNLTITAMQEVGSYAADGSGAVTVPAADIAPYVGDTGFIDVELPVTVVIDE
ncbi:hypothetical protein P4B35_06390 [Pontiellaceae bacterium B12227]|nr:hypothetical protein [Pontiellaceae bacterium B12227]